MRILFLDDMEARHAAFGAYAQRYGFLVDHAYTAEQAIIMLETGFPYVAASLDHDLADEHYRMPYSSPSMGGTAHSGRAVARWIAEHGRPRFVMIHSFNPDGAEAMKDALLSNKDSALVFRAPFGPNSCESWLSMLEKAVS